LNSKKIIKLNLKFLEIKNSNNKLMANFNFIVIAVEIIIK